MIGVTITFKDDVKAVRDPSREVLIRADKARECVWPVGMKTAGKKRNTNSRFGRNRSRIKIVSPCLQPEASYKSWPGVERGI
jgi:hypothetical protein